MSNLKILFVVIGCLIGLGIFFYFSQLYYFFYQDVIKTENSILRHQFPLLLPNAKEDYVSTWGAFGDFIGGTLNPIIGLISILLLFATWNLTRKTLNFTKEELKNSNNLLDSQKFDSLFFSVLQQLKDFEKILTLTEKDISRLDSIYNKVFYNEFNCILSYKREILKENEVLNQYFICLFQLYKMINNIFENETKHNLVERPEIFSIEKKYSNILRSIVPMKLQQLLFLNVSEEFELYRDYLNYYSFFEHMSFDRLDNRKGLNVDLIALAENYKSFFYNNAKNFNILGESIYYAKIKKSIFYTLDESENKEYSSGKELINENLKRFKSLKFKVSHEDEESYNNKYSYIISIIFNKDNIKVIKTKNRSKYSTSLCYKEIIFELRNFSFEMKSFRYSIIFNKNLMLNIDKNYITNKKFSMKIDGEKTLKKINILEFNKNPL